MKAIEGQREETAAGTFAPEEKDTYGTRKCQRKCCARGEREAEERSHPALHEVWIDQSENDLDDARDDDP